MTLPVDRNVLLSRHRSRIAQVRIGTWKAAGRWTDRHRDFRSGLDCDVLLLTEVDERVQLTGYHCHLSSSCMAPGRRWAGVLSRSGLAPLPDPHPASAMASVAGLTFCSSILPWRATHSHGPWTGASHAEKTASALDELRRNLPRADLVWGGDWNHALSGPEYAGSLQGRRHLVAALDTLGLRVPTALLAHRLEGLLSIDHIAVGPGQNVESAARPVAAIEGWQLSDHDAYVVELTW